MVIVLFERVALPLAPTLTPVLVVLIAQPVSLTATPLPAVIPLPAAGQAAHVAGLTDNKTTNAHWVKKGQY
ncbi:hypothetical protein D3C86_1065430 [compost metagenome]